MTIHWLDPIGACLALLCTYQFAQAKRFAWILGLITIAINSVLYWQKGIYGHLLLEAIYCASMIYGWFHWSIPKENQKSRPIRYLILSEVLFYTALAIIGIGLLAQGLILYTDSDVPYWDATTTCLSLIAQWLLCRKVIHCWILWFVVDVMMACLQFYKGIPFHSAVHWLYLGMAVLGYYRWLSLYKAQQTQQSLSPLFAAVSVGK